MATYTKKKLSGSTNGSGIKVVATATAGTLIHTSTSISTDGTYDEIWIYAFNSHTSPVVLTIEFGGPTAPDQNIVINLDNQAGLQLIVPGLILNNSLTVKAFASVANVVVLSGFVNGIS